MAKKDKKMRVQSQLIAALTLSVVTLFIIFVFQYSNINNNTQNIEVLVNTTNDQTRIIYKQQYCIEQQITDCRIDPGYDEKYEEYKDSQLN